jgi:signal transduction histidine kinase
MKIGLILIILLCISIAIRGIAQSPYVDSLKVCLQQEQDLNQKIEIISELARELMRITPEESFRYAEQLKRIADSLNNVKGHAHYYRIMAGINGIQGNYLYSTSFIFEAIRLYEELHDSTGLANSYITHANNYSRQKLYTQAALYYKKALKIFEQLNNQKRIGVSLTNLTFIYNNLGKYDSALVLAQRSIKINTAEKYFSVLINDYKNIATIYLNKGDYKNAFANFNEALEINSEYGRGTISEAVVETYIGLGRTFLKTGDEKEGYNYLTKGITAALENGFITWARDGYLSLSEYFATKGNYKNAFYYQSQYIHLIDSLSAIQRLEHTNLGDVYLNALRESYQNDLLERERGLRDKVLKQQRVGMILGVSAIGVLLMLVYYLKRSNNKRRKINYMLNEQKEEIADKSLQLEKHIKTKDKFFSIVAHDLRSPLNSLKSFTSLINNHADKLTKEEIVTTAKQLDSTIDNTIKMAESLLTWAKQQMQAHECSPEKVNVKLLVDEIAKLYHEAADQKNIRIYVDVPEEATVFADRNHFMFLIRNLVNNAIKFTSLGGTITIKARIVGDQTQISVCDTGIGMSTDTLKNLFEISITKKSYGTAGEKGTGLGLILCKEFVTQNRGKIWVESELGKGSTFYISLPQG